MNPSQFKANAALRPSMAERGVALVIVLFALLLLSILLVGFFTTATSDRRSSALYYEQGASKRLTDTAVNSALAQIRAATSGSNSSQTWASQPGAIRRYDDSGRFVAGYKLYTAGTMVETTSEANMTADLAPSNWRDIPSAYTDLNSPARTASGTLVFPIIDGNGMVDGTDAVSGSPACVYSGSMALGFSTDPSKVGVSYNAGASLSATNTPVPMPVMWHYLLQDGSMVVPQLSGTKITVAGATKANPIVGRIAYWTDDETAKVNVNTASYDTISGTSGGDSFTNYHAYHSPPFFEGDAEHQLARSQPARNEVQRYPGHPATTNLGVVFPTLTATDIFNLVPRVAEGGSMGGTLSANSTAFGIVTYDADRLYPTPGELLYSPVRSANAGTSGMPFNASLVEKARFFVTARSRAPELNLFGKPRVAIWPVHATDSTDYRTGFDQLVAFCSSLKIASGSSIYYLQRKDASSPTVDQQIGSNQKLFGDAGGSSYLQYMMSQPIPGFGGSFQSKYGLDGDQILTEIEDYIRCVNTNDPLLSPSNQYTKSSATVASGSLGTYSAPVGFAQVAPLYNASNDTMGMGRTFTIAAIGLQFICTADGSEGTIANPVTPSAGGINLVANPEKDPDQARYWKKKSNQTTVATVAGITYNPNLTLPSGAPLTVTQRRIEAMLLLHPSSPVGMERFRPGYEIEITGLDTLSLGGVNLGFPSGINKIVSPGTPSHSSNCLMFLDGRRLPARGVMPADSGVNAGNVYPFIGIPITVPFDSPANFSGGTVKVTIYSGTGASRQACQKLTFNFPSCSMPVPKLKTGNWSFSGRSAAPQVFWTFSRDGTGVSGTSVKLDGSSNASINTANWGRLKLPDYYNKYAPPIMTFPEDVLRGMALPHGDYRLLAANRDVASNAFEKCRDYDNSAQGFGNRFVYLAGGVTPPANYEQGRLVASGTYGAKFTPDGPGKTELDALPSTVNRPWTLGDWDTGEAANEDGAFNNWPDEGAATIVGRTDDPYYGDANSRALVTSLFASPNRIMASPGVFGSLPSGVKAGKAWQTLLFRPYYPADATGAATHPGAASPPDHLWMDLFWMPVVEPYAISETFSTAGKINMNYQILPFTYIKRDTGVRAVIGTERVIAMQLSNALVNVYKDAASATAKALRPRSPIDLDATLKQFELKFADNQIFKSATEICTLDLVPKGSNITVNGIGNNMGSYWLSNGLTGDNLKERPYTNIYPRLTTKSNTYQVHYRVQSLKKSPLTGEDTFVDPGSSGSGPHDVIASEVRGSALIERYLDPKDTMPDYASTPSAPSLENFYQYRVVAGREFLP